MSKCTLICDIYILGVSKLTHVKINHMTSSRHRNAEGYLSVCDEDTVNSVARVAAAAQVTVGYFENAVAGKITEPRVAFFWATFIIYRGRPKCI